MEVLAAGITVPAVLRVSFDILAYAYSLHQQVRNKKEVLRVLLERCKSLLIEVKNQIDLGMSAAMLNNIGVLDHACATLSDGVQHVIRKGFVWCLLHRDEIDGVVTMAESAIVDAFQKFNLMAHMNLSRLTTEIAEATKADQQELHTTLDELRNNDHKILAAMQDKDQQFRKLEELVVGLSKYVQINRNVIASDAGAEETFIRTAAAALKRVSQRPSNELVPHWVLTSLEVSVNRDEDGIGRGSFGCIYRGDWNGQVVAIKEMHADDARTLGAQQFKNIRDEVQIWSRIAHPHVLQFFGACLEAYQPFIVSRYCENGDAITFLRSHPDMNRIQMMDEISRGMAYLHSQNIVHADLKGVNVLIGDDYSALIADFGLSRIQEEILSTRNRKTSGSMGNLEGTLRWMAPECLEGHPATKASDVHSFAITSWEIFTGEIPYAGTKERAMIFAIVDRQLRPERPCSIVNDDVWALIVRCWSHDPSLRPTFSSIHMTLKAITPASGSRPKAYKMNSDLNTLVGSEADNLATKVNALSLRQDKEGTTKLSAPHSPSPSTSKSAPVVDTADSPSLDDEDDDGLGAIAIDHYVADDAYKEEKEISFRTGDIIVNIEEKGDAWWYGRKLVIGNKDDSESYSYGEYGWFPARSVKKLGDHFVVVALRDYKDPVLASTVGVGMLAFLKGDYINVTDAWGSSYWQGEDQNGASGYFPVSAVSVQVDELCTCTMCMMSEVSTKICTCEKCLEKLPKDGGIVVSHYVADESMQNEKEISLRIGEHVVDIEEKDNFWCYGRKEGSNGDCGWFPGRCVKKVGDHFVAVALQSYFSSDKDHLSYSKDDRINVTEAYARLWKGELDGRTGFLTVKHVTVDIDAKCTCSNCLPQEKPMGNSGGRGKGVLSRLFKSGKP